MRVVRLVISCGIVAASLAGCANPINLKTSENYFRAAQSAEFSGRYAAAREAYARSLINARLGHAQPATISMLTYNLGRMEGYVCNFAEAEKLLLDALAQEEKITGPNSGITSMRLFELARLNFDRRRFAESIPFYERGIAIAEKLGVEDKEPALFAASLDEWATALREVGRGVDAAPIASRAAAVKLKAEGRPRGFMPARYNQQCSG